jgi:Zn-dependent peptidase ImmA (M78 family)
MKYPALPKSVTGLGGAITVEVVESLKDDDGTPCWGLWNQIGRRVRVERSADKRHEWAVLYHELVHAALDDSGVSNLLSEPHVEALCDAIASARMRERFG